MAALECLTYVDYSLSIKAGVHFTLCGGTLLKLGTQKHHDAYLDGMDTLDLPGSFSMTELGHGSNVMGIDTTATYDPVRKEFVINTPNNEASKYWIGGTGQHGKITVVFAQLTVAGKWEGPHVFIVRIRDDNLGPIPGVRIKDIGPKMGLNGVDNGQLWFDNLRVPRDSLLDAVASVDDEGAYRSSIPSVSQRFGTMVGGLTTGRMLIAQGAIDGLKLCCTIAIRYSCQRPQFGDRPIMSYLTHQDRLFPVLANTYALHLAMGSLKELTDRKDPKDAKAVHVISSGVKAASTWLRVQGMQACRECCGGMGFLSANTIGPLSTDMNVDVTFEGDNTVLMQQVTKALVDDKEALVAPPTLPPPPVGHPAALSPSSSSSLDRLVQLLQYREKALVYRLGTAMKEAAEHGGGAAAAAEAFDANLDVVLSAGWSNVERFCLENFRTVLTKVDPTLRPALQLLATLYGASCVKKDAAFFLTSGALTNMDLDRLRVTVHSGYSALAANGGALALRFCDGFGIPEALITAPIAKV